MRVTLFASDWESRSSAGTYASGLRDALVASGLEVAAVHRDTYLGRRHGAFLLPMVRQWVRRYDVHDGSILHDTWSTHALANPDVTTSHDTRDLRPQVHDAFTSAVARQRMRHSFRVAKATIFTTAWEREEGARLAPDARDRFHVIPIPMWPPDRVARGPRPIDVLWVGTWMERKGLDELVALAGRRTSTRFAVVSRRPPNPDPRFESLARAAHVDLFDRGLPREELLALFDRAKVILSTSRWDTYQRPIVEGYLRGARPCVPRAQPYLEIYADVARDVVFYEPSAPLAIDRALAEAVERGPIAPDPTFAERMSPATVAAQHRAIYERIARR
ncbi:MAG TPA: hypothetical protein VEL82_03570 [Thermoplasmata archaeon]|nr:hypothetical protein [Thermoplasmata archaeon]